METDEINKPWGSSSANGMLSSLNAISAQLARQTNSRTKVFGLSNIKMEIDEPMHRASKEELGTAFKAKNNKMLWQLRKSWNFGKSSQSHRYWNVIDWSLRWFCIFHGDAEHETIEREFFGAAKVTGMDFFSWYNIFGFASIRNLCTKLRWIRSARACRRIERTHFHFQPCNWNWNSSRNVASVYTHLYIHIFRVDILTSFQFIHFFSSRRSTYALFCLAFNLPSFIGYVNTERLQKRFRHFREHHVCNWKWHFRVEPIRPSIYLPFLKSRWQRTKRYRK